MRKNSPTSWQPAELLQALIRFDTTNPPGNEAACIQFIQGLLSEAGVPACIAARSPERPNLVARWKGAGTAPPLLLYGHVDVVTTQGQQWRYPPFDGRIEDGWVWGRGALDMKGGVAMLLAAFLKAVSEGASLPGDLIFAAVADEEASGTYGARFLVEEHAGLFQDVRFALSEFGGFNLSVGGKRFYPIQVAEKQACWMKASFHGQGGHASMPVRGGAMARLARALHTLDRRRLPAHVTPPVRMMIESIASNLPFPNGFVLRQLLNPALAGGLLDILGGQGAAFAPLLHNTVSPTQLQASEKINVIPSEVTLGLDGRLLPGAKPEQMLAELRLLLGDDLHVEVMFFEPGPPAPDMGLFDTLAAVLREADPTGVPVPLVNAAVTDARFFSRLGIQTYGFVPLQLPTDFNFIKTIHAANERVPVAALDFGVRAIYAAIQRYH